MFTACLLLGITLTNPTIDNFKTIESQIECKTQHAAWYQNMDEQFDLKRAIYFKEAGRTSTLLLQPTFKGNGVSFRAIANGRKDSYFQELARKIRSVDNTFYLAFAPELADWQPYRITPNNTFADFKKAFRRVTYIFKQQGAKKVKFMFVVNNRFNGDYGPYSKYYPGDDVVDYVGIDGYNWGQTNQYNVWQNFDEVFSKSYAEIKMLTNKPIFISETASVEDKSNPYRKAIWIKDLWFKICTSYTHIQRVTWFSIKEERDGWMADWRIDSSINSIDAFKSIFAVGGSPCQSRPVILKKQGK